MNVRSKMKKNSMGKLLIAIYILAVLAISANARAAQKQSDLNTGLYKISN
jgi:hypothetical protein